MKNSYLNTVFISLSLLSPCVLFAQDYYSNIDNYVENRSELNALSSQSLLLERISNFQFKPSSSYLNTVPKLMMNPSTEEGVEAAGKALGILEQRDAIVLRKEVRPEAAEHAAIGTPIAETNSKERIPKFNTSTLLKAAYVSWAAFVNGVNADPTANSAFNRSSIVDANNIYNNGGIWDGAIGTDQMNQNLSPVQNLIGINEMEHSISEEIAKKEVENYSLENAKKYALSGFENTYFLGYRDLPYFLGKYVTGKKAIDYGCGPGRSTRFLKDHGFEVVGVDTSEKMLEEAIHQDPTSHYLHITSAQIPVLNNSCDLVLSCFVMLTVPSKQELHQIFQEVYRSLKVGGIFIVVTSSEELFSHQWLSYNTDYPQNKNLKSGDSAKIQLKDLGIEFIDYYWTDRDYTDLFQLAKFKILERHFPLGKPGEGREWVSETKYAPYTTYVLQKVQDP